MTRRELMERIKAACQRITKANGFSTDAGMHVSVSVKNIAIPPHDLVLLFAGPVQYDAYDGTTAVEKSMEVQLNLVLSGNSSAERVSDIEVDVLNLLDQQAYEWGGSVSVELLAMTPVTHELHDLTEAVFSLNLKYI